MGSSRNPARFNVPLVIILLIVGFGGGYLAADLLVGGQDDPAPKHAAPTATPTAPPPAGDLQAAPAAPGEPATQPPAESALRDETPPDVPKDQLQQGKAKTDELGKDLPTTPQPVGGAQNYSVKQDFSGQVYSSFGSVTPTEFCLHYTVSPNVTGWGDVLGIQAFFKRTRAASASYIGDFEGHLLQMVPLTSKAWTQGAFNPFCRASIEIIATGRETRAQWEASNLIKGHVLSSLMHDVMTRYGLPLKFVDPVGCAAPPGYTDHNHIECGNDHTDVSPNFPFSTLAAQLAQKSRPHVTSSDRRDCRSVHAYRLRRKAGKPKTKSGTAAFEQRLKRVRSHGLKCVDGKAKVR